MSSKTLDALHSFKNVWILRHVGDVDGIYGVMRDVSDTDQQLMLLEHERRIGPALQTYDIRLSHDPTKSNDISGIVDILSQMGCNYSLDKLMHYFKTTDPEQ